MDLSVIIPTHNPDAGRLARTLAGLCDQTLAPVCWETLLIDNASNPPLERASLPSPRPANLRLLREPTPGLAAARLCGLRAASADLCVFVDDDNVLAPGFLAAALALFAAHPSLGAAGGPTRPEFEAAPAPWIAEFFPLLALRDLGPDPQFARLDRTSAPADGPPPYPRCAPIGAGMVLRRRAAYAWMNRSPLRRLSDRRGPELTSGGDNDIVLSVLRDGWDVAYSPDLALTHLIPAARLAPAYLARLNRGIQKSWMQVLAQHDANPWPPIARWTVAPRQAKAWFTHRAWSGPAAHIRWQGACGHFEGRIASHPIHEDKISPAAGTATPPPHPRSEP